MKNHSNLVFLKYRDCSRRGADVEGVLLVTPEFWALKKAQLETQTRPLFTDSGHEGRMDWEDGPTLLGLIEPVSVSDAQASLLQQTFKLHAYPLACEADKPGAEGWRTHVLAGFGEIGFLDKISIADCEPQNERNLP
jgi:hypothetical protein